MIRAFIAVNLAPSIGEEIAKIQALLKAAQGDIRWARIEGMHLTLKFLGDIAHEQVEPILAALRIVLSNQPALQVQVHRLGAFPHLNRPRVLWVGLRGDRLTELQEKVESALVPLDFPREERGFTPHLTLGRVRSSQGWERVRAVVRQYDQAEFGVSDIDRVILYQSTLRPDGAVYSPLGTVPLQKT